MLGRYLPFLRATSVSDYTRKKHPFKKKKQTNQKPMKLQSIGTARQPLGSAVLCCAALCSAGGDPALRAEPGGTPSSTAWCLLAG